MPTPENVRTDDPGSALKSAVARQKDVAEAARKAAEDAQREREETPTESEQS